MNFDKLTDMMIQDEDEKFQIYQDDNGNWTVGIGYNLSANGISKNVSRMLFKECTQEFLGDLSLIFIDQTYFAFPSNIQMVLFNMRFQMGYTGFRRFKRMILAVKVYDWYGMIREMKDSIWYHKYTSRAERLIALVEEVIDEKEN